MRKTINNLVYLSIAIVILCNSCKKDDLLYQLEIPNKISSTKDTLSIGDTLWVESDFSDKLYDKLSGNTYFYGNKLPISFICDKYEPIRKYGTQCFDLVNIIGASTKGNTIFFADYVHQNGRFKIKFGLVAKETGLFSFAFSSAINYQNDTKGEPVDFNPKVNNEYASIFFKTTSHYPSNHYELVKDRKLPSGRAEIPQDAFDGTGSYAFIVK